MSVKDNNGYKGASEVDKARDITLIIFWQVGLVLFGKGSSKLPDLIHSLSSTLPPSVSVSSISHQALVPSGGDIAFSYGHCTLNVPLPHSMAALSKVRTCTYACKETI